MHLERQPKFLPPMWETTIPESWFHLVPAPAVMNIWGGNHQRKDEYFSLHLSVYIPFKYTNKSFFLKIHYWQTWVLFFTFFFFRGRQIELPKSPHQWGIGWGWGQELGTQSGWCQSWDPNLYIPHKWQEHNYLSQSVH